MEPLKRTQVMPQSSSGLNADNVSSFQMADRVLSDQTYLTQCRRLYDLLHTPKQVFSNADDIIIKSALRLMLLMQQAFDGAEAIGFPGSRAG